MTYLLDTSALLAFFLGEWGAEPVRALFDDNRHRVAISVITKVEFWTRLKSLGREADFEREWSMLQPLFDAVLEVDDAVAEQAIRLRCATPQRLPTVDALIAATAAVHGLTLVHRDPHFREIPPNAFQQLDLGDTPIS